MSTVLERPTLDQVVELAEPLDRTEADAIVLQRQAKTIIKRINGLIGVEENARDDLQQGLQATNAELAATRIALDTGLPCVSMEPLTWRREQDFGKKCKLQVPVFALFHLNSSTMVITASRDKRRDPRNGNESWLDSASWSVRPDVCLSAYRDIGELLAEGAKKRKTRVELIATFTGLIPDATKAKTLEYGLVFGREDIFLLAETDWDLKEKEQTLYKAPRAHYDPLVLGYKANRFWLIDRFDPTPVEQYVLSEFVGPLQLTSG